MQPEVVWAGGWGKASLRARAPGEGERHEGSDTQGHPGQGDGSPVAGRSPGMSSLGSHLQVVLALEAR